MKVFSAACLCKMHFNLLSIDYTLLHLLYNLQIMVNTKQSNGVNAFNLVAGNHNNLVHQNGNERSGFMVQFIYVYNYPSNRNVITC